MDVPLCADHFGHIGVNSCIRLGKALEKYNMAWLEDMIPWQYTELWKQITDAVDIPTLTGEDIYLKEPFNRALREPRGGYRPSRPGQFRRAARDQEDRRHGQEYGVPMAMHFAGTPDFVHGQRALRRGHGELPGAGTSLGRYAVVGRPGDGPQKPIVQKGFIQVPETPGWAWG
jgi:hypothetical protein